MSASRALIVVPTSLVSDPQIIADLKARFAQYDVHQQLAERLDEKAVSLPVKQFEIVHLASGKASEPLVLANHSIEAIYEAMKDGAVLDGAIHPQVVPSLIVAGLAKDEASNNWKKITASSVSLESRAVPLRKPGSGAGQKRLFPKFKKAEPSAESLGVITPPSTDSAAGDNDDLLDEDDLVVDARPAIKFPAKCDPGPGNKRRKACKDCTCGLKELEENENEEQRATQDKVITLTSDDMAEIDFTVPGKAVGGCGSCALGDAFRCDGCPYLGLPPFKPGEVVSIDQFGDDF